MKFNIMNKTKAKKIIIKLVSKYEKNKNNYHDSKYNETLLRSDFLDPFFEALGWDIKNKEEKPTNEREVILEESLKGNVSSTSKKPDYTFRLFSERKFFLEAKKPFVSIEKNADAAKQVRRYGFTAKLKISILSNFEHLAIYDCSGKVNENDNANIALIKRYHYSEYERKFDEIYNYLSKESVYCGEFDKIWSHIEDKINRFSVDDLFLEQIRNWRLLLASQIYRLQNKIKVQELNDTVQSYLNSIIFLRVCEDRNLEQYKTLLSFATSQNLKSLIQKFERADQKYNSGLFDLPYKENIINDDSSVFWTIIKNLYYPESPYSFSVFSSDILGNIYEIFLSEKLSIKNKKIVLEKKPEHVDRDIITTPTNIIHDILRQTVIPFCMNKTDEEILKAKFSDIACGSGAFLLETYQLLNDNLIDYYLKHDQTKLIQTSINTYKLPFSIKKKLLLKCIYGIDKDYNAVQACKFGLLLKLLESETNATIPKRKPILPNLNNNILFGNSLLNSKQVKTKECIKINPFDFENTKYDVIVGNPPYMKSEDMKNITPMELPLYKKYYKTAYKQFDKYFLFIEKGYSLLKNNGYLGFIVPSKFAKVGAGKNLRNFLLKSKHISNIISFGANQVFKDKSNYTCLLILHKKEKQKFKYIEVDNFTDWKIRNISNDYFNTIEFNSLNDGTWILMPSKLKKASEKIIDQSIPLGELIGEENIFNGIQTSANQVYVHKATSQDKKYYFFEKDGKKWKVEKKITRPYFQTLGGSETLYTYHNLEPNSFVIYPYKKIKNKIELIEINELKEKYPFAYKYLTKYKKILKKRDIKPAPKTKNEWYRYGRHQSLDSCEVNKKIIVGVLSLGNKYAIDNKKTLISSGGTAGYCMITIPEKLKYSIYYIQALLNSKYLEWYSSLIGEVFRGGYIARGTKVLKQLPIRKIDFSNKKEKNAHDNIAKIQEKLIETYGKLEKAKNKRDKIPIQRIFERDLIKLNTKIKTLYQLKEMDSEIPIITEKYEAN